MRALEAFDQGVGDAGEEQDGEDCGVLPGEADAGFDQPPVVDAAGDGGDVDEAVEALPVLAAHGAHDEGRRGAGEGEQDDPGEEADLDEAALVEVVPHGGPDGLP